MVDDDNKNEHGCPYLTPGQIDKIAEEAATKAVKKMTNQIYMSVGKSVVSKVLWGVGVITVVVAAYFHNRF